MRRKRRRRKRRRRRRRRRKRRMPCFSTCKYEYSYLYIRKLIIFNKFTHTQFTRGCVSISHTHHLRTKCNDNYQYTIFLKKGN